MLVIYKIINRIITLFRKVESRVLHASFFARNADIHSTFRLGINNSIEISEDSKITIAENVWINQNNFITLKGSSKLIIGKNTYITRTTLACLDSVTIGENCILGEGLKIFDHNHQYTTNPFKVEKNKFNTAPIIIGNNCWTGANVTILKGVTIGDNVIIGAGCTIHKNIPSNTMVLNKQELIFKSIQKSNI